MDETTVLVNYNITLACNRYADRLLALAADAFVATQDLHAVKTGSVYLAASQTTGIHLLPTLIGALPGA